jgi:two-component system, NarL family, nitrate/nitrite response regulator NarL
MIRVLVVDDHPMFAMLLAEHARTAFATSIVESAHNLDEALERARVMGGLEACLLDLGLPGCKGIEALTRFQIAFPETRVVVISALEERSVVLACLEAGAVGYIPKTSKPEVVSNALKLVAGGGVYVPTQALQSDRPSVQEIHLTGRQLEVLRLIALGLATRRSPKASALRRTR